MFLEASVQTRPGQRRHVTWRRVVTMYARQVSFGRLLTSGRYVRAQLTRVMRSGCRVFVRVAEVGRGESAEVARELARHYDYAWCPRPHDRRHRDVLVPNGRGNKDDDEPTQIAGLADVPVWAHVHSKVNVRAH